MPKWIPSYQATLDAAHMGWGTVILLTISLHCGWYFGLAGLLIYTLVKEFIIDMLTEDTTWGGEFRDFCWYWIGGLLGSAIYFTLD